MQPDSMAVAAALLLSLSGPVAAQRVLIKRATPADVVEALKAQLLDQGFKLEEAKGNDALFALDRGMVNQQRGSFVQQVQVVLELHLRFKQKPEEGGLEVNAYEEVVGARRSTFEFRRRVQSREERDAIQQILDQVKADLEARPAPPPPP